MLRHPGAGPVPPAALPEGLGLPGAVAMGAQRAGADGRAREGGTSRQAKHLTLTQPHPSAGPSHTPTQHIRGGTYPLRLSVLACEVGVLVEPTSEPWED